MSFPRKLLTLLSIVCAFALPAYANNPPQPDGLFSILLVFPIIIFGSRLSGLAPKPRKLYVRIIRGVAVGICSLVFLAAGTEIGALAALVVMVYAIVRAYRIMRHGQGAKSQLIGAFIAAFSLFAFVDYWASIVSGPHMSSDAYEYIARMRIERLGEAGQQFSISGKHDVAGGPIYGAINDLEAAHMISSPPAAGQIVQGYLFGEILDTDRKHFLFYAIPAPGLKPGEQNTEFVPGASLVKSLFGAKDEQRTGRYSFAVDETGKIRRAIRNTSVPVTREEVSQWQLVQ